MTNHSVFPYDASITRDEISTAQFDFCGQVAQDLVPPVRSYLCAWCPRKNGNVFQVTENLIYEIQIVQWAKNWGFTNKTTCLIFQKSGKLGRALLAIFRDMVRNSQDTWNHRLIGKSGCKHSFLTDTHFFTRMCVCVCAPVDLKKKVQTSGHKRQRAHTQSRK